MYVLERGAEVASAAYDDDADDALALPLCLHKRGEGSQGSGSCLHTAAAPAAAAAAVCGEQQQWLQRETADRTALLLLLLRYQRSPLLSVGAQGTPGESVTRQCGTRPEHYYLSSV
jgi:hypothetical protein